jgi:probable rRNA maturation factor
MRAPDAPPRRRPGRSSRPGARLDLLLLDRQRRRRIPASRLRLVLAEAARVMGMGGAMSLVLGGDTALRRLNARYRGRDRATDVLSFPAGGGEAGLGDVLISVPAAERNARRLGRSLGSELQVLALHGFLHLIGYDHETDDGEMDRVEARLRRRLIPGSA